MCGRGVLSIFIAVTLLSAKQGESLYYSMLELLGYIVCKEGCSERVVACPSAV